MRELILRSSIYTANWCFGYSIFILSTFIYIKYNACKYTHTHTQIYFNGKIALLLSRALLYFMAYNMFALFIHDVMFCIISSLPLYMQNVWSALCSDPSSRPSKSMLWWLFGRTYIYINAVVTPNHALICTNLRIV